MGDAIAPLQRIPERREPTREQPQVQARDDAGSQTSSIPDAIGSLQRAVGNRATGLFAAQRLAVGDGDTPAGVADIGVQREPAAGAATVAPAPANYRSAAQMMAMTLSDLKRYADAEVEWANNPALLDAQRETLWRWVQFARDDDANLAGCGKSTVTSLEHHADTDDKRRWLSSYAGAISGARSTARIQTAATSVDQMVLWGEQLFRLEEVMSGPTVNRIIDEDAWKLLSKDKALVDYIIAYVRYSNPVLDADNGSEITSIAAMRKENTPYQNYVAVLPEVKNYHRFLDAGLKQVAANKNDTSKTKPLTLVLHSALDHNGAFHRDPNMRDVLADKRNLTLLIEGAEKLDDVRSEIGPLADMYGRPGADGKGKIDQLMIAGHGNANLIELGGSMEMGNVGKMAEQDDNLKVADHASTLLIDELLVHMDPASPHHKVVFNACLTNSNAVDSKTIRDGVAAGMTPADAVKAAMKKSPSFTAWLADQAKVVNVAGIEAIGANNSIATVPLQDARTGALDLRDPDDPAATGTKLQYTEKGAEPLGVMRSVVESWAMDKPATLDAMQRRVRARTVVDWRSHIVTKIFEIILANYPDDIVTINDFSEWAGSLGEGNHKEECRVGPMTPPTTIAKHMPEITSYLLSKVNTADIPHLPLVLHETELILGIGPAAKFLASLSGFNCKTADEFVDARVMTKSAEMLGALDAAHLHGQLLIALLDTARNDSPTADSKAFLLANGVKNDALTAAAGTILARAASEDKILNRLGIVPKAPPAEPDAAAAVPGHKPADQPDADPAGDKEPAVHVDPVQLTGQAAWPFGEIDVRAKPDAAAASVGKLLEGSPLTIVGKTDDWFAVVYNLRVVYIERAMVDLDVSDKPVPFAAKGVVSDKDDCDVFASPDDSSKQVGALLLGDVVTIVTRTKDWYGISYEHGTGYVHQSSVHATRLKFTRIPSTKGTVTLADAPFYDNFKAERKEQGKLVVGDLIDVVAKIEDEVGSPTAAGGTFFAFKKGATTGWIDALGVALAH